MVGRRPTAKTCNTNCRVKLSNARKAGHKTPAELDGTAGRVLPEDEALELAGPSSDREAQGGGRIEQATRAKLAPLGRDDDPLAVYLLSLARTLDNPGTIAGGSLTAVGKEFRETYAAFFREHGEPEGDAVDRAQDEVAAKRAELEARKARAREGAQGAT